MVGVSSELYNIKDEDPVHSLSEEMTRIGMKLLGA